MLSHSSNGPLLSTTFHLSLTAAIWPHVYLNIKNSLSKGH